MFLGTLQVLLSHFVNRNSIFKVVTEMKKRVMPYGLGKTFIRMEFQELPKDIQEGIIERFKKRDGNLKVTKDTVNIVIACEDIFANDK